MRNQLKLRGIFLACVAGGSLVGAMKPCKESGGDALNFLAPSAVASFMHALAPALPPKLSQAPKTIPLATQAAKFSCGLAQ